MEIQEEVDITMSLNHELTYITKRKRTKRQRSQSPILLSLTTSSSTENDHHLSLIQATSSTGYTESTEEEEDMANCLILLAKGHNNCDNFKQTEESTEIETESRRFIPSSSKAGGFDFYKCKNCDRCFPSFQALGGHMTSHKKPKNMVDQEAKKFLVLSGNQSKSLPHNLQISNIGSSTGNTTKSKVHECSICGSEYSSGQALGGHMRRHRTTSTTTTTTTITSINPSRNSVTIISSESAETLKISNNFLPLDLNLPAPEDDPDVKFRFCPKQSMVFSASLVDCHY